MRKLNVMYNELLLKYVEKSEDNKNYDLEICKLQENNMLNYYSVMKEWVLNKKF